MLNMQGRASQATLAAAGNSDYARPHHRNFLSAVQSPLVVELAAVIGTRSLLNCGQNFAVSAGCAEYSWDLKTGT